MIQRQELEQSFLDIFQNMEDPRSQRNRLYTMSEILLGALCACICGSDGWQDVEDFCKHKLEYLRKFLPYKNGAPRDDTFRRFFRALNPDKFQELFREWMSFISLKIDQTVIAIDGKSSRHSFDNDRRMLHMISAYATEARLVLAQEKVAEKSNEITAIPKLLEWLDLAGNTVTIDAMGCQFEIANQIIKQEGDYIFSLKGNQSTLHEDVIIYLEDEEVLDRIECYRDYDKGHGRIESRTCFVCNDVEWLRKRHSNWHSIKSIIRIDSIREDKKNTTEESRYYISSSLEADASKVLQKIRSHWSIENSLHWTLDMSFGDDSSRIRKGNAPQIMAIMRHIALNLLQLTKAGMKRQSIKRLRKIASLNDSILSLILKQKFS